MDLNVKSKNDAVTIAVRERSVMTTNLVPEVDSYVNEDENVF